MLCGLLLGAPMMACLVPNAQLSADEEQCCKEMAGECQKTDSDMPASHSCCNTVVQLRNDLLPSASVSFSVPLADWTALDASPAVPQIEILSRYSFWLTRTHAPPGPTLDALVPLRI
jgi:hypothetical protein